MKAIVYTRYGPAEVLQLREVDKPIPGSAEVLVRVQAANVVSEDCTFRKGRPLIARMATGPVRPGTATPGSSLADDLVLLKELAEAGAFRPVIDRTYTLEQSVEAHRYVDLGHKKGNVVLTTGHVGGH